MADKRLFTLKDAEQIRESITLAQQKEITQMYIDLYNDVCGQLGKKKTKLTKANLLQTKRRIENRIRELNDQLERHVIRNMNGACEGVTESTREFLLRVGFSEEDVKGAYMYVPKDVVSNIVTGNIYQDGWTLSQAIWGYNDKVQKDLTKIIAIGTEQGKSAYDIAKDLEFYVSPSSKKPSRTITSWRYDSNGNKVKDTFRFGKVDYNAQRLSRTMISHAYQQSFENVNRLNPFVKGYKWLTSNFHGRVCDICRDRAETDKFGLGVGVFPKGELPLDHPNGMCTFSVVLEEDLETIGDMVGDWYNAPIGTYPDIDLYASSFVRE